MASIKDKFNGRKPLPPFSIRLTKEERQKLDQLAQNEAEQFGKQDPVTLDGYQVSNFSEKAKEIPYRKARTFFMRIKGGQEIEISRRQAVKLKDMMSL